MTPGITRRRFLAGTLATGAAMISPNLLADSGGRIRSLTDRVKIGNTGIESSYLGFGTGTKGWNKVSNQTKLGTVKFARMIRHAFDQGVNFFDVADIYGTHTYLRASLKGIPRDKYVVESKLWFRTSEGAQKDLERFLTELRVDYLDILLLHCVTEQTWTTDLREMMDFLDSAKQKKLIRAHGISIHDLNVLRGAADVPWVDTVLARVNPLGAKMDAPASEVVPAIRKVHDAGKGVVGIKILGEGTIAEKREESLRFVLGLDCVDAIVIGFEGPDQVDDILKLGAGILKGG